MSPTLTADIEAERTRLAEDDEARRAALLERLNTAILGFADLLTVYIGHRLELYTHLAESGPLTANALAEVADIHPRYARE